MSSNTKKYEKELRNHIEEYFHRIGPHIPIECQWVPFQLEAVSKYSPRFSQRNPLTQEVVVHSPEDHYNKKEQKHICQNKNVFLLLLRPA
ncbi:MAG: hypothetical protein QXU99_06010 [Candidatus Bathyarchaeia archaeon]